MLDPRSALLSVDDLQAWYGESHILHGVTFEVFPGEVVTLPQPTPETIRVEGG